MKRTWISLVIIIVFIIGVSVLDLWFVSEFAAGMTARLDAVSAAETLPEKKELAEELDRYYQKQQFWAHRLIPTGRLEELEMLLHKLNAYLKTEDEHEIEATAAELRARVNLLYSTDLYHWYHPFQFRIE